MAIGRVPAAPIALREPLPTPVALIVRLQPAHLRGLAAHSVHRILRLQEADRGRPRLLPHLVLVVEAWRRERAQAEAGAVM